MTWNVLYGSASSPLGGWSVRGPLVRAVIEEAAPDIVCLQEIEEAELPFARSGVPGYSALIGAPTGTSPLAALVHRVGWFAVVAWALWFWRTGPPPWSLPAALAHFVMFVFAVLAPFGLRFLEWYRGPFRGPGEFMPILHRPERVRPLAEGSLWLSRTPNVPASRLPLLPEPRVVHWARFERVSHPGAAFLVVNAHLGHAPWHYAGSTRVLLDLIAAEAPDPATPVLLLGDFNAVTGSGVMRRLRQALRDATEEASRREGPYETFQWNASKRMRKLRLDHVLVRGSARALASSVLTPRDPDRGLPPSDHDPLVVDFEI